MLQRKALLVLPSPSLRHLLMGSVNNFSTLAKAIDAEKSRIVSQGSDCEPHISVELRDAMQAYFAGVLQNLRSIRTCVDELASAVDNMEFRVHKIRCQIPVLADKQFIENRVAEEDVNGDKANEDATGKPAEKVDDSEPETPNDLVEEAISSILKVFPD
uniref:Biogenesis of lysosome-related organelles complex 1 subunit 3 n=1 Tax=Trichuris muris TaxID=70415 RepID=A0A5S6QI67_TRIMR